MFTNDERKGFTSASNAQADLECPGRHLAQRGIPEPVKSADATSGTKIHNALKLEDPAGLTVDEADVYDSCLQIRTQIIRDVFGDRAPDAMAHAWKERRFWVKFRTAAGQELMHSGMVDYICRSLDRGLVVDYKTLPGEVAESSSNLQLRDLAVLARGELIITGDVLTAIIQPLVTHRPEVTLYSPGDLAKAELEMLRRVEYSNSPAAPRHASRKACAFCLAKNTCQEYQMWAGAMVPGMLSLLDVPVDQWSPEQRRAFCDKYDVAAKWLEGTWAKMQEGAAATPGFVPGYEMVPGATVEKINDPQQCFNRFLALGGTADQFMAAVAVTKGKLKEQIAAVKGARGMALDKLLKEVTAGIVTTRQNAPSLKKSAQPAAIEVGK